MFKFSKALLLPFFLLGLFVVAGTFAEAFSDNTAAIRAGVTLPALSPQSVFLRQGDDLQAALNNAAPGDAITLEAGAIFVGNFTLPVKQGTGLITIRSSASDADLPASNARVSPDHSVAMPRIVSPNSSPALKAEARAHHYELLGLEITIAPGVMLNNGIVVLGQGNETDPALLPHDITIDRCYIHGQPLADVARGVALNSINTEVINSYISEIHGIGFDTQAIACWNGPGPFKIINNYLEGAGENVMFGGADPKIADLVPTDIEFQRNHCFKPIAWKEGILSKPAGVTSSATFTSISGLAPGATYYYRVAARGRAGASVIATSAASDEIALTLAQDQNMIALGWNPVPFASEYRVYRTSDPPSAQTRSWTFYTTASNLFNDTGDGQGAQAGGPPASATHWSVKNLFELKNARRVLISGNVFENNWVDGQSGFAILITVRNQEGNAPWCVIEDVTFTNNLIRHSAAGMQFIGRDNNHPSQQLKRAEIINNLFEDIGSKEWGNNGRLIQITETQDVKIDHNTAFQTGNLITAHGAANERFVFTNNIVMHNDYGIIGDGTATGMATIDHYFPDYEFKKNVIVGAQSAKYPKKNFFPATIDDVGFIDPGKGNFHLGGASPYKNAGKKSKDPGVDIDELEEAERQAIAGSQ